MPVGKLVARIACAWSLAWTLFLPPGSLHAQRFVDPGFQSYPVRSTTPEAIESSLRTFLADRIDSGEAIDIVPDRRGKQILVRGSSEVQKLVSQFLKATDRTTGRPPSGIYAQAGRTVEGYRVNSAEELGHKLTQLRKQFANRDDVRIAGDERSKQLIVHAPAEVHHIIATQWAQSGVPQGATQPQPQPQGGFGTVTPGLPNAQGDAGWGGSSDRIQLQHVTWKEVLRGLRGGIKTDPAVRQDDGGHLRFQLISAAGEVTSFDIDPRRQIVELNGPRDARTQWKRVVEALDAAPEAPGEQQALGKLGDARPSTITRTITLLGGAGSLLTKMGMQGGTAASMVSQLAQDGTRKPLRVAQAAPQGQPAAGGAGEAAAAGGLGMLDDATGSFLGPVRIEFLEGTDIFIVRGQKRDVDRVMQIIKDIEELTLETEPEVEILDLNHANSRTIAALLAELNENSVLSARQGDISVTPLGKPNALLLIGRKAGVDSIKALVQRLDVSTEPSAQFRVFPLIYVPVVDAERTVNNVYNQASQQADETVTLEPEVRAVADYRSNSLVVYAGPRDLDEIEDMLKRIDVKASATVNEVRVFQLKNALAEEVAEVLDETLGNNQQNQQGLGGQGFGAGAGASGVAVTQPFSSQRAVRMKMFDGKTKEMLESAILTNVLISANERANSVVVTAPEGSMELIAEIIRQLDELPAQEAELRVFTVINGDAASLSDMLTTLFEQDDQQDGPVVQSATGEGESSLVPLRFALDPRTNSIIASGNGADLKVVEAILLKLDASDVRRRRTEVYELLNQQASAVAVAVSQFIQERRAALTTVAPDAITDYELLEQEVVVVAEDNSNKVIISATDRYFDEILQLIKDLDKRPDMVLVQCLIAEVQLDSTEEMGVELGIQDSLLFDRSLNGVPGFNFNNQPLGNNVNATDVENTAGQALSSFGLGRTNSELGYGGLVLSASSESISVLIRALQESRRLDILSRPQVMMLNNSTGDVLVGASVPFIQNSQNTGLTIINTVDFIDVGLTLEVSPRISPDGLIVMQVLADKSELGAVEDGIPISVTQNGDVIRQPQINRTRAETIVSARDGQTVILGGLITKTRSTFERKVPYLGDVPLFGRLFRADGITENRTELLIILTPHIIRDEADLNRVNSEEYARMSWCLGNVIATHGDIGPYGMDQMIDGEVIYPDLGSSDFPVEYGSEVTVPGSTESLMPQLETAPLVPPAHAAPPIPASGEAVLPQARTPRMRIGPPSNQAAKALPRQDSRLKVSRIDADAYPTYAKPAGYQPNDKKTQRDSAVFRLGDVPVQ